MCIFPASLIRLLRISFKLFDPMSKVETNNIARSSLTQNVFMHFIYINNCAPVTFQSEANKSHRHRMSYLKAIILLH